MARIAGPVWIVQPEFGEAPPGGPDAHPEHPIVLPPDTPPDSGAHPEHPIVIPDPGGGDEHPDHTLPGDLPKPDHELPGDQPRPEHPIVLPGEPEWPDDPKPTHPIVLPDPYPDNSLPPGLEQVGDLEFYQRKTLGINWDPEFDPAQVVGIYAGSSGEATLSLVRTVANNGASSVTYPQDFTGTVVIRVAGVDGYLEGTTSVT